MMNLCWVDFIFLNEARPDFAIFTIHMFTWNLFVLQHLHVKWKIFQIDLLNIVTGSCCNCYILLWTNWFDFRPLYSNRYSCIFKLCTDFTLSVSHCLKHAQLACPPQSRSGISSLSLLTILPGLMFYSSLSERLEMIWLCSSNPTALQELALRRWGQGWDTLIARALKFPYCCSCWSNSKNKHSRGLSNHSHFYQSYILTPCVYFSWGFCFICF